MLEKNFYFSYQESEMKLEKIAKIIQNYPTNKKIEVLYEYAKKIMEQNRKDSKQGIINITELSKLKEIEERIDSIYSQIQTIISKFNLYDHVNAQTNREYLDTLEDSIEKLYNHNDSNLYYVLTELVFGLSSFEFISLPILLSIVLGLMESPVWKITACVEVIPLIAFIIRETFLKNIYLQNEEQIKLLEEEYNVRKDYYDLKDKIYTFSK